MRRLVVPLTALIAAFALAAAAYAGGVSSNLTINVKNVSGPHGAFFGELSSTRHACETGEKVRLYFNDHENGFQRVGTDKTNSNGRWRVKIRGGGAIPAGKYYAATKENGSCPAIKTSKIKIAQPG